MYRVRTVFTGATGSPWVNTLYFDEPAGTAQAAANAAAVFWQAVDSVMHTSIAWSTEADVVQVNEQTGLATGVISTEQSSGAGATGTDMLPPATQALVRLLTGVFNDGRQVRGRIFIPGLTEAANTSGGNVEGTTALTIRTAAEALIEDTGSELLVWSRSAGNSFNVTGVSLWSQFAVLRSRRD